MTFENLSKLTHATLLNDPFVSSFYDIVLEPARVKRGDLFVGNDPEAIREAVDRDAYAILSDRRVAILDDEIAWLRCDDIDRALLALLRYRVMQKDLDLCYCDEISIEILEQIAAKEQIRYLGSDLKANFQTLMHASPEQCIFSSDLALLEKIAPAYRQIENAPEMILRPLKSTLFHTTFYYRGKRFEQIRLPQIFLSRVENLLYFLERYEIRFDLHRIDYPTQFYPIFVSRNLTIKPFGTTPQAIIATDDKYHESVLDYIANTAPWARTVCISDLDRLKEIEFNFAIIDTTPHALMQRLQTYQIKEQVSLFQE